MKTAIVLYSGGLDSTACLYWAKEKYKQIILLSFIYGSKEDQVIQKTNVFFSKELKAKSRIIKVPFLAEFSERSGSLLSNKRQEPPILTSEDELNNKELTKTTAKEVWVPGRNILFLSIAASFADSFNEPVDIIFGANKEEGVTFPDNTTEFVEKMNTVLELGCHNMIKIQAPFSEKVKTEIASFLFEKKAKIEFSSSCYRIKNWTDDGKPIHCGSCESCLRRKRAFKKAKIKDPTIYEKRQ